MKLLFFIVLFWASVAQESGNNSSNKQKIIYKYNTHEMIDLGNLEIKGTILAPGDISVKERARKTVQQKLLDMPDFDRESVEDVQNLR